MPVLSSAEIIVNTTTAGSQVDPAILVLGSGITVVSWTDGSSVRTQLYNADGSAFGSEIVVADSLSGPRDVNLTTTATGGFVVTWSQPDFVTDLNVYGSSYDGAGSVVSAATPLIAGFGNQYNSTTTTLANGDFVLVWTEGGTISTQVYTSAFSPVGAQTNTFNLVNQSTPDVVAMSDGSFVVTYAKSSGGSNEIYAQVFNTDGTIAVSEFLVNSNIANNQHDPQAVALADGNFAVVWHDDPGTSINARIMGPDGSAISAEFVVNSTSAGTMKNASITQLSDGRIAIAWEGNGDIRGRLFDSAGLPLGDDFMINIETTADQANPKIVALTDGRFTVTYTSLDGGAEGIRSVTIDPNTFFGTSSADTWKGGGSIDIIYGYAGHDILFGNGGNDFINGGAGNDTIDGGDGDDTVYGDAGVDDLKGGLGNDKLFAGTNDLSTDTNYLDGGYGDDILYAGSGKDTFKGGLGSDTISYFYQAAVTLDFSATASTDILRFKGAATGDKLALGDSVQSIEGSATGNDIITGSDGANVIKGLGGNDTLNGGKGIDTLFGGVGADTLNGGDDNDVIYGEAGNDTIDGGLGNDVIYSGLGADSINGGLGLDTLTYYKESTGATMSITGGAGSGSALGDTSSGIENLYGSNNSTSGDNLTGNALANNIRGYGGNDYLSGSAGADTLDGGTGSDYLNGGADNDKLYGGTGVATTDTYYGGSGIDSYFSNSYGNDIYKFNATSDFSGGVETINAFNASVDKFQFLDTGFSGLSLGAITAEMFVTKTDGTHAAVETDDRFIYDAKYNTLYYDNDGSGSGLAYAVVKFTGITSESTFNYLDITVV